jgi:L-asparaginase II
VAIAESFGLLAVTERSGVPESYHFGTVVGLDRSGRVALAVGDPELVVYGRSTNKPMQAVAMLRAGLALSPRELAVASGSHSGTPAQLDAVRDILAQAGLDASALANTPDYPLDPDAMRDAVRSGRGKTSIQTSCSGKHAAMLATCAANGWEHRWGAYLQPSHPLQQKITSVISSLAGRDVQHVGVDGCGAPAQAFALVDLARAFRAIATAQPGTQEHQVYCAMTKLPVYVGGPGRHVTQFMRTVPGLMAKDGADGMYAAALPDGRAVAAKLADGSDRAAPTVLAGALQALGVDVSATKPAWQVPVLGHGLPVGSVIPVFA